MEDKLRVLEPKKARNVDGILNKMLKHTEQSFKLAILKLYNDVLCVGFFPEIWNQGLISPIHKNGDKLEPNNYRGICVNSNLGKVFCSILNKTVRLPYQTQCLEQISNWVSPKMLHF